VITAQNSFGGVVTLTTNSTSCTLSPGSVAGSGRSILSCTFTAAINVSVIVTGTTGSLSHAALVTYVVEDFAITGAADPLVSPVGANATSSVTLRSLNGYSGTVNITATVLCSSCPSEGFGGAGGGSRPLEMAPIQDSPSTSFNPVSIGLSSGGTGQASLTITLSTSVQAGNYTITVTASDGTISHSVALMLIATDFRLSALTTILFVAAGNNSTQTLTLLSLNGFQGSMLLSSTTSPSGPLASLNPSSIYLTSYNGTVLAITVPSNTTSGNYVVTVTAVSGSTIHMITITVTVYSGFTNVLARMLASGGIATTLVVGLLTLVSLFPLYATGILARPDRRDRQTSVHRIRTAPSPKRAPIASSLIMTGLFWTLTRDY